jgi:hypothetical protein
VTDTDDLRHAARVASGRADAELGSFIVERLTGAGVTNSVERASGTLLDGEASIPFSVVRKEVRASGDDLRSWAREPDAYSSGLLDELQGISAPRLLLRRDLPDGAGADLWLEDVAGDVVPWTLDRFERVARALGRLAAPFASGAHAVPDHEWLSTGWLEGWVDMAAAATAELELGIDDPMLGRLYPPEVADGLLRLWHRRAPLLATLRRTPIVLGHLDATPANTVVTDDRVLLLDWAFTGCASLGEDLGSLVGGATLFAHPPVPPSELPAIAATATRAYVDGLAEGGYETDPDIIHWALAVTAALRYAVAPAAFMIKGIGPDGPPPDGIGIRDPRQRAMQEQMLGRPFNNILEIAAATSRHLILDLGDHALRKASEIARRLS